MTARRRGRRLAAGLALLAGVGIGGCTEVESTSSAGYEPSKLQEVEGSEHAQVAFTAEGAKRTGLETVPARQRGRHRIVPYAALLYDGEGSPFVYTASSGLSFRRAAVAIARIEGSRVLLTDGPPPGSRVVTTGVAEVYGAELEIAGSH